MGVDPKVNLYNSDFKIGASVKKAGRGSKIHIANDSK